MVLHRPLLGKAKTCTIKRDVDQWFVCISCEREVDEPAASTLPAVGVDRGVMMLLADSEGGLVPNPGHGEQRAARMANAQRAVARKQKGSQNQRKARVRVARLQRKVRRQREHTLHTLSSRYAKNHGVVVVEDLQIKNMTASAKGTVDEPGSNVPQKAGLNRRILDAGWGKFVELLSGKLSAAGGRLVKVPAAYSSQTCAVCGVVDAASRVTQASFVCTGCGHQDHADSNAAKVILSRRTGGGDVCRGDSVARPLKQKLRVARRGTVVHGGAVKSPAVHGGDGLPRSRPPAPHQLQHVLERQPLDPSAAGKQEHQRVGVRRGRGVVGHEHGAQRHHGRRRRRAQPSLERGGRQAHVRRDRGHRESLGALLPGEAHHLLAQGGRVRTADALAGGGGERRAPSAAAERESTSTSRNLRSSYARPRASPIRLASTRGGRTRMF